MQIDGPCPVVQFCIGLFLEGVLFLMIWDVMMRFNMIDCYTNDTTLHLCDYWSARIDAAFSINDSLVECPTYTPTLKDGG